MQHAQRLLRAFAIFYAPAVRSAWRRVRPVWRFLRSHRSPF